MLIIISLLIVLFSTTNYINKEQLRTQLTQEELTRKGELYKDILITMINPEIEKALKNHYKESYTSATYDVTILEVEKPQIYKDFLYKLKLEVIPYTGPNLCIGKDHLTILIDSEGRIKIEEYENIEKFNLPPEYKH